MSIFGVEVLSTCWAARIGLQKMAKKRRGRKIEYLPPNSEVVYSFARELCQKLAETDPECASPEIVRGLAEFLMLAGKIQAKHLNRINLVDRKED